jgi:hypothetical protein
MVSPRCLDSRSCGKTDRRLPSYADNAAPSINRRSNLHKVVVTGFEEFPAVSRTENNPAHPELSSRTPSAYSDSQSDLESGTE